MKCGSTFRGTGDGMTHSSFEGVRLRRRRVREDERLRFVGMEAPRLGGVEFRVAPAEGRGARRARSCFTSVAPGDHGGGAEFVAGEAPGPASSSSGRCRCASACAWSYGKGTFLPAHEHGVNHLKTRASGATLRGSPSHKRGRRSTTNPSRRRHDHLQNLREPEPASA